jgi:hypothetical protein
VSTLGDVDRGHDRGRDLCVRYHAAPSYCRHANQVGSTLFLFASDGTGPVNLAIFKLFCIKAA